MVSILTPFLTTLNVYIGIITISVLDSLNSTYPISFLISLMDFIYFHIIKYLLISGIIIN